MNPTTAQAMQVPGPSQVVSPPPAQPEVIQTTGAQNQKNIFEGVSGLTPRQMYLLKKNMEDSQKEKKQKDMIPEEYKYVFTKNYIIVSTLLIIVSFVVFGLIVFVQVTGFSTKNGDSVLGVDSVQAKIPATYSPES